MHHRFLRLAAPLIAAIAPCAQAQLIDDVEWRRDGADAVLQVRFVAPVQFRRVLASRDGDIVQVFYDVVGSRELPPQVVSERRLQASGALPEIVLGDDSAGRGELSRRLVVRLAPPTALRARAGRGDRSIELVFAGAGASVGLPPAAAVPAPAAHADADTELDARAAALLAAAVAADAQNDHAFALARLNELLELPPNASSRRAQELAGDVRLRAGDSGRARAEYEAFLRQYPLGEDADRVRQALARLSGSAERPRQRAPIQPSETLTGSAAAFYYGGASKVRTQEFQDSPISGLPELARDDTLSGTDQRQLITNVDVNWRYRDADSDMRFVFRDAYTADQLRSDKSRNRLSALYFEHRSLALGTGIKLGRQSPTGGGVLGRFDGVQGAYTFAPKWRVNAVLGAPTDPLLDAKRHLYGAWVDADALAPGVSGSLYLNQQMIDGEVDRRALGSELRYFDGGSSLTGVLDYDTVLRGWNIVSLQGTWQSAENTVVNALLDQRATPMLMLGNALFFGTQVPTASGTRAATSIADLLASGFTRDVLRANVAGTSTATTQALLGLTTPVSPHWQVGGDLRLTRLGELPPIADILPNGQGKSDNQSVGLQVIGSNLYSARDTHVIGLSWLSGTGQTLSLAGDVLTRTPYGYDGWLLSYNNSSQLDEHWLLEPSLKFYRQTEKTGVTSTRTSPGLRVTYRAGRQLSVESELNAEFAKVDGPMRTETSRRVAYSLGARYDF